MALSRGTSTDYKDLLDKLDEFITGDHVATISINAAGTSYVVDDILTVAGGTSTKAARIIVTSVGGSGEITGARIYDSGAYSVDPTLTANAVTGGTGSSATFDLTMEVSNWTKNLDDATLDSSTERVVWWEETTTNTYVGVRTYSVVDGVNTGKNWLLFGATSYNGALGWWQQPNINPNAVSASDGSVTTGVNIDVAGMYLKDNDGTAIDYWFFVTTRRIIVMAKLYNTVTVTPRYSSCYLGLLNAFGTSSEYPYPIYVAGSMADEAKAWNANDPAYQMSGLTWAIGPANGDGPGFYRHNDGNWKPVMNQRYTTGSSSKASQSIYVVYPVGQPENDAGPDVKIVAENVGNGMVGWGSFIRQAGSYSDIPEHILMPTRDTGGEKRILVPATVILSYSVTEEVGIVGELDGVYWACASGATTITSEDTLTDNGTVYRAFANGTYRNTDGFQFLRET